MLNLREIAESIIKKPGVFLDETKLYPEYVPEVLPHREEQFKQLTKMFKHVIVSPGSSSARVVLYGSLGTGKTATAISFGKVISRLAGERGVKLKYVHVNCASTKSALSVFREVKNQLGLKVPDRGLGFSEFVQVLLREMDIEDLYAVVTLDEFDSVLLNFESGDRYSLVRFYDIFHSDVMRLNFIYVSRMRLSDIVRVLDEISGSYMMRNTIVFNPYRSRELYDILNYRAEEAFYPGVVGSDVFEYIANLIGYDTGGDGNARKALAILYSAGKLAEREIEEGRASRVLIDHVRAVSAREDLDLIHVLDSLNYLNLHQLLILKSIAIGLKETGSSYVSIGRVEEVYRRLCQDTGLEPRKHTQIYYYVTELASRGVIMTRKTLKGRRGRSSYVSFGAAPLNSLLNALDRAIAMRREIGE
ncbi:MAG: ORC1-type DNA replication protein [Sulfolobales archaeon]|nr:ORC1-type DNA replication protein [Sulfolobales archaeon]MDW8082365.1 ORC1-type DNA replication protein [Sulfolobales archaeon]